MRNAHQPVLLENHRQWAVGTREVRSGQKKKKENTAECHVEWGLWGSGGLAVVWLASRG
jgi:hypothetical protein